MASKGVQLSIPYPHLSLVLLAKLIAMIRIPTSYCVLLLSLFVAFASGANADETANIEFFEKKIRPVLVEYCYECHSSSSKAIKGELRLDTRETIRKGGESGTGIVPGDLEQSSIISALKFESVEMPPKGKLSESVIADFEKWIADGAIDPREAESAPAPASKPQIDWKAATEFWSFQHPKRHDLPSFESKEWIQRPIDAFILAKLESEGLYPNDAADRRTLLRRASIDLIGLPPSEQEMQSFLQDESPTAYQVRVEQLLSSARFGERWARVWLDVARYAEDQAHIVGDDKSLFFPNAYLYRNWVVRAFNLDMPYDQFVRLQLAADLMSPDDREHWVALGFIGLGPKYYRRNAPDVMAEEWEDRVDTVTRGLLGVTVACARCHDHKYDPFPTEDYYALAGVFAGTEMLNMPLDESVEAKDGHAKDPDKSMHVIRDQKPRDIKVMIRGNVENEGELVERGFPRALNGGEKITFKNGSGRLELADAIASPINPLTARVIVNRVWGQYFGKPLVGTPSNFGKLGERPSHPELLDDLAVRFMQNGWSLKWLHREIVLSATYQQSSTIDFEKEPNDPANQWLWRANRRRLSVEAWRDSLLVASGAIDYSFAKGSIQASKATEVRRTLYSSISRFQLDPLLVLFDFPDPNAHSERRSLTTTPLQKLFAMNSDFMLRQAEQLVDRLMNLDVSTNEDRIRNAYASIYSRNPDQEELQLGMDFLKEGSEGKRQWTKYLQTLLASNELLIMD